MLQARFGDSVWAVTRAHGLSECDACDVAQTVWLRLYQQLGHLRAPDRLGAWLATTTRRECLRLLREQKRQVPYAIVEQLASEVVPGVDELGLREELRQESREVWRAFAEMPVSCQMLLRLLIAEPGLTYQMVSEALGMPIGSIGPRRARCLERLRANLLFGANTSGENGGERDDPPGTLGSTAHPAAEEVS